MLLQLRLESPCFYNFRYPLCVNFREEICFQYWSDFCFHYSLSNKMTPFIDANLFSCSACWESKRKMKDTRKGADVVWTWMLMCYCSQMLLCQKEENGSSVSRGWNTICHIQPAEGRTWVKNYDRERSDRNTNCLLWRENVVLCCLILS